jgi:hypothetical protein
MNTQQHRLVRWAGPMAALAAPAIVVAVAALAGDEPYSLLGLGDPGTLVRVIPPLLRLIAEACAVICLGSPAFAAFFAPSESGRSALTARVRPIHLVVNMFRHGGECGTVRGSQPTPSLVSAEAASRSSRARATRERMVPTGTPHASAAS